MGPLQPGIEAFAGLGSGLLQLGLQGLQLGLHLRHRAGLIALLDAQEQLRRLDRGREIGFEAGLQLLADFGLAVDSLDRVEQLAHARGTFVGLVQALLFALRHRALDGAAQGLELGRELRRGIEVGVVDGADRIDGRRGARREHQHHRDTDRKDHRRQDRQQPDPGFHIHSCLLNKHAPPTQRVASPDPTTINRRSEPP